MLDAVSMLSRSKTNLLARSLYVFLAVLAGLGLLGKASLVRHILPVPAAIVYPSILVFLLLPLAWPLALRWRKIFAIFVCFGIVGASLFIYPRMQSLQKMHRGSDQPDCIIVAAKGIGAGEWPYDTAKLWTHDPMSCGPGWVMMQTPAILAAGYRWNLLLLWIVAILVLRSCLSFRTIAGLLTLVGLSAATWVAASDGTDFLPFGILLAALFIAVQVPSRFFPLFLVLVTLVIQFRFPMLVLPILFFPLRRVTQGVVVSVVAFVFHLFFLIWRPQTYIAEGPLHLFYKLTHTHILAVTRWSAVSEVSLVFILMVAASLLVRRYIKGPWIAFAYLLVLTALPAILDIAHKRHEFGSLIAGLGIWEGGNWLSGCIPLAAVLLLSTTGELNLAAPNHVEVRGEVALSA
jgi:hypothetical protein